jgi:DNA-binding XRE family transcriptional regulator
MPGLREARERAGLTQSELADRADVSRQTVGAAEAGRHVPAVDAAIRIAAVLGEPVESLFGRGAPPRAARTVCGPEPGDGDPVLVGEVGDELVAVPLPSLVAGDAAWAAPDGVVEGGEVRLLPGATASGLVVVGCDPVLGLCETLLNRGAARRLLAVPGSTGAAVAALAEGSAHAALVHGPDDVLPEPPRAARRVHLARWRVGVGVAPGRRARSLEAVLARVPLIEREESAASQQALLRAAGASRRPSRAPERARGHIDAARRAALAGCAAVTFEPAARQERLRFIPLETHRVELWIDERWADHPGARALGELLASSAFARRVGLVGGYDLDGCGTPGSDPR